MVHIRDPDAADRIIALEGRLGWEQDPEWEEEIRATINSTRKTFIEKALMTTPTGDGMIYGIKGWDRFEAKSDGNIVFLQQQSNHDDKDEAGRIAEKLGFTVQ